MTVSVVLCTYNRCRMLERALESASRLKVPESWTWEILVVDNNSGDDTRATVEDFCRRHHGRFRYLFEPRPGKSSALNTGVRAASGEIVAFMDDDVVVEPLWLQNLIRPLLDTRWAGAGGRILPDWNSSPPEWLPDGHHALSPLAVFDRGTTPGALDEPPFGTNMAFRKALFDKYGYFRTDLGPRPGSQIRSEDTEFGQRLLSGGERLWYEPSALVYHPVPENRLRREYFLAWWFDKGRANIREYGVRSTATLRVAGVPLYLVRNLAVASVRWLLVGDRRRRFARKLNVWHTAGAIAECYRQNRSPAAGGESFAGGDPS